MDKITMLGTGHAMTFDCFNTCFVYENENGKLLVDTGGGGQLLRQLRDAGISSRDIDSIFISHRHTDHLLGLPWLFRGLGGPEGDRHLTLYLHRELMETATGMLRLLFPEEMEQLGETVRFVTVGDGDRAEILGRPVTFLDLHSPNVTQYGFVMTLPGDRRLVFHGDVPFHEANRDAIAGADWLMHEAFHLASEPMGPPPGGAGKPMGPPPGPGGPAGKGPGKGPGHSTVKQAASYAESLGVKHLILFHGSDNDLPSRQRRYTEEARQVYGGDIYVPYDLDVIEL